MAVCTETWDRGEDSLLHGHVYLDIEHGSTPHTWSPCTEPLTCDGLDRNLGARLE